MDPIPENDTNVISAPLSKEGYFPGRNSLGYLPRPLGVFKKDLNNGRKRPSVSEYLVGLARQAGRQLGGCKSPH